VTIPCDRCAAKLPLEIPMSESTASNITKREKSMATSLDK
jgi:hypothetical protein